jgi:hypothetical protein
MSGSDYGDLKRVHVARKNALEAEKKRKSEEKIKDHEKLKRENAHGYPTLDAAHTKIAREASRKQNARTADAQLRDNASAATSPSYDNLRMAKPMQVDRQFAVPAKAGEQQPVRSTGQLSPSPGGTVFSSQQAKASPARGEGKESAVKKSTAKVTSAATHANVPTGSRPTGRGGRR